MATVVTTLRVLKTQRTGTTEPRTITFWEGSSIKELSMTYPPSDIFGADPLGRSELDGGLIITDYTFQQFVDGAWIDIDDPRVRLTPMTAQEREIDRQNRLDFPGDYITDEEEDEDQGDDPYGISPYEDEQDGPEQFYCPTCEDHGCELCMIEVTPEQPDTVPCRNCGKDTDAIFGVCQPCADDAERFCPICDRHHGDTNLGQGDLCSGCDRLVFWRQFSPKYWPHHLRRMMNYLAKKA